MHRLRKHLTSAHLIAFIALFAAVGTGGAIAANTVSSRDIRNNSVTSSDIRNNSVTGTDIRNGTIRLTDISAATRAALKAPSRGPAGPAGPAGRTGSRGATGARGPTGRTGATGARGATGATGAKGDKGDKGDPGGFVDTLPPGRTLKGVWTLQADAATAGDALEEAVSFPFALAKDTVAHFVANGGPKPAECAGSAAEPTAAAGHLCVYQGAVDANATGENVFDPTLDSVAGAGRTSRLGFSVRATAAAAQVRTTGTWAVTAAP